MFLEGPKSKNKIFFLISSISFKDKNPLPAAAYSFKASLDIFPSWNGQIRNTTPNFYLLPLPARFAKEGGESKNNCFVK